MKTLKTILGIVSLLMILLVLHSCKKDEALFEPQEIPAVEIDPESRRMIDHLVKEYGFAREAIVNLPDELAVDGDISFPKAEFWTDYGSSPEGTHKHYRTSILVTATSTIHVSFDPGVPDVWEGAFYQAIYWWNSLGGGLTFSYCDPPLLAFIPCTVHPGVRVSYENLSPDWPATTLAITRFPTTWGNPGSYSKINSAFSGTLTPSQMLYVAIHELGHAIGLKHTDSGDGTLIKPTGNHSYCRSRTDPSSVMRATTGSFSAFSPCDIAAYKQLYPR